MEYIQNIELSITSDKKSETGNIQLDKECIDGNIDELQYKLVCKEHSIALKIKNNFDKAIVLKQVCLKFMEITEDECRGVLIVPELAGEMMKLRMLPSKTDKSYMFSLLLGAGDNENRLLGFLGSCNSQNYIRLDKSNTGFTVEAVCNLVNEPLEPSEEFQFDPIYFSQSTNYIELLNEYEKAVYDYCPRYNVCGRNLPEESIDIDILFSKVPDDSTLSAENKLCSIKLGGTRYYLRDIKKEHVKNKIVEECTQKLNILDKPKLIRVKDMSLYINKIIELSAFNVYKELHHLFIRFTEFYLEADDCPTAVAKGCGLLLKPHRELADGKKNKIKIINNKNDKNDISNFIWDYAVGTVVERRFYHNLVTYKCHNKKIENIFAEIANNIYKQDKLISDIRDDLPVNFYIPGKGVLAVMRYGDNKIYIAVFNLSDNNIKFYWDLSQFANKNIDGTAKDILTDEEYLIVNKKIYINNIKPMDCLLISKALN